MQRRATRALDRQDRSAGTLGQRLERTGQRRHTSDGSPHRLQVLASAQLVREEVSAAARIVLTASIDDVHVVRRAACPDDLIGTIDSCVYRHYPKGLRIGSMDAHIPLEAAHFRFVVVRLAERSRMLRGRQPNRLHIRPACRSRLRATRAARPNASGSCRRSLSPQADCGRRPRLKACNRSPPGPRRRCGLLAASNSHHRCD